MEVEGRAVTVGVRAASRGGMRCNVAAGPLRGPTDLMPAH